jgi:hypothetical protein
MAQKVQRVKIGLFIDTEIASKFRSLIQEKYKTYEKGLLSYEAEMALRHWLSLHAGTQTSVNMNVPNPTPKVALVFAQVKNLLMTKFGYFEIKTGQQIPKIHLENAIADVRGSDERTVVKWLKLFGKMKLVKPITAGMWEIL